MSKAVTSNFDYITNYYYFISFTSLELLHHEKMRIYS
jgi:hypothetical protein